MSGRRQDRVESLNLDGFWERLRLILKDESEGSFANRANISKSGFHRVLNGGLPALDMLIAIANAGDVGVEWLATGTTPEATAWDGASADQTTPLDISALQVVIESVEKGLQDERLQISPSKKSEIIAKFYSMVVEDKKARSTPLDPGQLRRLLRLVV